MNHKLYQNARQNQKSNALVEEIWNLVSSKGGWVLDRNISSITFEYFFQVDSFETKKIMLLFEERKNSYKLTINAQMSIQGVEGGQPRVTKIIDLYNSQASNDLTTYTFSEPNLLQAKLIL